MNVKLLLHKPFVHIFFIVLLALIAYSNTFQVPFQFDDYPYIVENPRIKSLSDIPSLYKDIKGYIGPRPVTLTTFVINYYLGGLNTFGYHVFNIAIHIINGFLLYFLIITTAKLLNYTEKNIRLTAFFLSLVFAVHPIQTECVTYITGRSTPLITFFYLSGIMLFVKAVTAEKGSVMYTAGLFLTSVLGMASRENFVTFPFMLLLYDFFFVSGYRVKSVIRHYKIHVPVMLSLVYFAYLVMSYEYGDISYGFRKATPIEYLMTQFNVHWTYLRLLVLPINQNLDYNYPIARTLFEFPTILSFIGYLGLWSAGLYYRKKRPVISFGILWFMITLSPVSSVVPLNNMIFEHRMYLPSIGIFAAISACVYAAVEKLRHRDKETAVMAAVVMCSVIILALTGVTYARNTVWKDRITLWEDAVSKSPDNARAHNNLGLAYKSEGLADRALEHYQIAIKLDPALSEAYNNLGVLYHRRREFDKAIPIFMKSISLYSGDAGAHNNLGLSLIGKGMIDLAIEELNKAIQLRPYNGMYHVNLGIAYMAKGLNDSADKEMKLGRELLRKNVR